VTQARERIELSVIIPCFNGVPWITEQLDSLVEHPYDGPWELILIDNMSSDETFSILQDHARCHPACRTAREESPGKAAALNRGIGLARGDYVVLLDQDDQVTAGFLDRMVERLAHYDVVGGIRDMTWKAGLAVKGQESEGLVKHHWLPAVSGCALGVRTQVAREIRFSTDVGVGDDLDFSWRAQLAGYHLGLADDAVLRYRLRGSIRSRFKQGVSYGEASVLLYCKFRGLGLARRSRYALVLEFKTIAYLGLAAVRSKESRYRLAYRVGLMVGSCRGSARQRVWCI
jgi:glycosyltransferase involved in cell wall biosynthesis